MAEPAEPYCYTVDEIAAMWKCSRQHVHAEIRAGRLRVWRCGRLIRIQPDAVEEYRRCSSSNTASDGAPHL